MFRLLTIAVILAIAASLPAQSFFQREKRDYIWLLGYASSAQVPGFGGTRIDFNYTLPTVAYEYRDMNFEAAATSICDAQGNLLFYSNGIYVANYLHEPMENGTGLNPDPYTDEWADGGCPYPQVILALPQGMDQYLLVHCVVSRREEPNEHGEFIYSDKALFSRIDMSANDGEGMVTLKNISLLQDTIDRHGKITAVRHANGRDWWVVIPEYYSNGFYRLLVTPDTILNHGLQAIGDTVPSGLGQAAFSPDGTKYARLNIYRLGQDQYVDIYDFDRCTGTFSNPVQFTYRDTALMGGLAFSENSRFLYVSSFRFTYQFDLEVENVADSKTIVGFPEELGEGYFLSQLAPNRKIYIGTQGTTSHMHIIHNPNKRAPACNFEYIGLPLPTRNFRTIPNFPYYGLGPVDGSSCDTLGIDNPVPVAAFEYTADSAALAIEFFDGSFFATGWYWNFGDGTTSTQRHPVHSYAQSGAYTVCLTASNMTGSDMVCDTIQLGEITSLEEPLAQEGILRVYPNPASHEITLVAERFPTGPVVFRVYDALGREVLRRQMHSNTGRMEERIDISGLPAGAYFWRVEAVGGKLVVIED